MATQNLYSPIIGSGMNVLSTAKIARTSEIMKTKVVGADRFIVKPSLMLTL